MEWAMDVMGVMGYFGVILVMLLETVFPVLPSEVTLPFIGYLTVKGTMTLPGAIAAATVGCLAGAIILYWLSYRFGREAVYRLVDKYGRRIAIDRSGVDKADKAFLKYGPWAVFLCRMMPVVRVLISIPAGIAGMRLGTFAAYTGIGAFIWNLGLIWTGAALGNAWEKVGGWVELYGKIVMILAAIAISIYAWRKHTKH